MKRLWLDREEQAVSRRRQCPLLGVNWSSLDDQPRGESAMNLVLMKESDEQETRPPFDGVCKMTEHVRH